jgi:hypothetical protein
MYIYLDESGDFGLSDKAIKNEPYMVIAAVVIKDKRSRVAIAQAVSRAIIDWRRSHQRIRANPDDRIKELKGTDLPPEVRQRLFKLVIRRGCDFEVHAVGIDKRDERLTKQSLPSQYMRRYAMLVHNVLSFIRPQIRKNQRWITMVSDSQARAKPMPPGEVRYHSKRVRLQQVQLRKQDRQRRQQYRDFVVYRFRNILRKKGTHLAVWLKRSEEDRCLQFADVVVNFVYEGLTLRNKKRQVQRNLRSAHDTKKKQAFRKQLKYTSERLNKWEETRKLLQPKLQFMLSYRLYDKLIYRTRKQPSTKPPPQ